MPSIIEYRINIYIRDEEKNFKHINEMITYQYDYIKYSIIYTFDEAVVNNIIDNVKERVKFSLKNVDDYISSLYQVHAEFTRNFNYSESTLKTLTNLTKSLQIHIQAIYSLLQN